MPQQVIEGYVPVFCCQPFTVCVHQLEGRAQAKCPECGKQVTFVWRLKLEDLELEQATGRAN